MNNHPRIILAIFATVTITALTFLPLVAYPTLAADNDNPLNHFTRDWRDNPIWYDGQAECAVYEATRTIYGKPRQYLARIFTNKENLDLDTFTKSNRSKDPVVFKHHIREDIPTKAYNYHYSTMTYIDPQNLTSLKIDMGSQEDCGATYKQFINRQNKIHYFQSSYFPNEGRTTGSYQSAANLVFHNALPLILRGYPFNNPQSINIQYLPDQTTTHLSPTQPQTAAINYLGLATVTTPYGEIQAHKLELTVSNQTHHYWFAADPQLLNVMVKYQGPDNLTFKLKELNRCAYWK